MQTDFRYSDIFDENYQKLAYFPLLQVEQPGNICNSCCDYLGSPIYIDVDGSDVNYDKDGGLFTSRLFNN